MLIMKRALVSLVLVVVAGVSYNLGENAPQPHPTIIDSEDKSIITKHKINDKDAEMSRLHPGNHKNQAEALTTLLEDRGYTVQRGTFLYITPERCKLMPSCYANNPPSPYGVTLLPKAPHEDTSTYSNWGVTLSETVGGKFMSSTYRLDANETILTLGQTAPRALYYAYIPYVLDRWYPYGWSSPSADWSRCPEVTDLDGGRCKLFASLGNPINMLNMNTSMKGGQSFSSSFAYYMGGDQTQIQRIQNLSIEAGIPKSIQNVFGLSIERANLGLTKKSDAFMHLTRTAFVEDKDKFDEYIYKPNKFITILRITPAQDTISEQLPFPPHTFKDRISEPEAVPSKNLSHRGLTVMLENDLKFGIIQKYKRTHQYVNKFQLEPPVYKNGYDCMDWGMQCNGDNQDTLYPNSRKSVALSYSCKKLLRDKCPVIYRTTLQKDGSDFFIVTGVNHNATKRALYSSISMYSERRLESLGGFNSLSNDLSANSYRGSANEYLKNSNVSEYFFAVKVSRKCEEHEKFCLEVAESGGNSLPLNESCIFIERSYLDHMRAGPTNDAHVKPVVYHFSAHYPVYSRSSRSCNVCSFILIVVNVFMIYCK